MLGIAESVPSILNRTWMHFHHLLWGSDGLWNGIRVSNTCSTSIQGPRRSSHIQWWTCGKVGCVTWKRAWVNVRNDNIQFCSDICKSIPDIVLAMLHTQWYVLTMDRKVWSWASQAVLCLFYQVIQMWLTQQTVGCGTLALGALWKPWMDWCWACPSQAVLHFQDLLHWVIQMRCCGTLVLWAPWELWMD